MSYTERDANMEKNILSLKNVYRFLTVRDYVLYSTGVIRREFIKGMTLVKFLDGLLLYDFRSGKYGKMIWRMEGSHNRYISELCNRKLNTTIYGQYASEILEQISPEMILRQIRQCEAFLAEHQYDRAVFGKKLTVWLEMLEQEDSFFENDVAVYFNKNREMTGEFTGGSEKKSLFADAWFLTMLIMHALLGPEMGNTNMRQLRSDEGIGLQRLWKLQIQNAAGNGESAVRVLTRHNNEITMSALPRSSFFGREKELFELREMLDSGGKYLLCGIGGIGKTELLRQFFLQCMSDRLIPEIGVVQYQRNLTESLIRAFPDAAGANSKERITEIIAGLRMKKRHQMVLFIDNISSGILEDQHFPALRELPVTVIATSRMQELEGFENYPIEMVSTEACKLIFRNQYGQALSRQDKTELEELCGRRLCRHTLTVRMMARVAHQKKWSVKQLLEQTDLYGLNYTWYEAGHYHHMQQVYQRLYKVSDLDMADQKLLEFFSLLSYESIPADYLEGWLPSPDQGTLKNQLEHLSATGWLESGDEGYAMHPVIAEAIGRENITEKDMQPFLDGLCGRWKSIGGPSVFDIFEFSMQGASEEQIMLSKTLVDMGEHMAGVLSPQNTSIMIAAYGLVCVLYGLPDSCRFLDTMEQYIAEDDQRIVELYTLQAFRYKGNIEAMEKVYHSQKLHGTVPEKELECFCFNYGTHCMIAGCLDQATEVLTDLYESTSNIRYKVLCCCDMATIASMQLNLEDYDKWQSLAWKLTQENDVKDPVVLYRVLDGQCNRAQLFRKFDEFMVYVEQIEELLKNKSTLEGRMYLNYNKGMALSRLHQAEEAIPYFEKAAELGLLVGDEDIIKLYINQQFTIALDEAGHYERCERAYLENLEILKRHPDRSSGSMDVLLTYNNMGVLYQHWGKWEKSREALLKARELAVEIGGIAIAEVDNNLSMVCHHFGETDQEQQYLRNAVPGLEAVYGPADKKVMEAKSRLIEE